MIGRIGIRSESRSLETACSAARWHNAGPYFPVERTAAAPPQIRERQEGKEAKKRESDETWGKEGKGEGKQRDGQHEKRARGGREDREEENG